MEPANAIKPMPRSSQLTGTVARANGSAEAA